MGIAAVVLAVMAFVVAPVEQVVGHMLEMVVDTEVAAI